MGMDLTVTSVNGNEGFFVGSPADHIYIVCGGGGVVVGESEPPRFQPNNGQKVNLAGSVQRVGLEEVAKLKLPRTDKNGMLSQGAFVNANKVTAAG